MPAPIQLFCPANPHAAWVGFGNQDASIPFHSNVLGFLTGPANVTLRVASRTAVAATREPESDLRKHVLEILDARFEPGLHRCPFRPTRIGFPASAPNPKFAHTVRQGRLRTSGSKGALES